MARLTRTAWELEDGLQPLVALAGCGSVENGMGSIAGRGGRPRCGRVGNPLHRQHGGARSPARGRGKKSTQQAEQLGRSRGGLTTKIHARVDGAGRLFTLLLTLGQQHDSTVAQQLMQQGAIRKLGRGGFLDRSWREADEITILAPTSDNPNQTTKLKCNQYWLGCPDATEPGEARFTWMDSQMNEIVGLLLE